MKKFLIYFFIAISTLVIFYWIGPHPHIPQLSSSLPQVPALSKIEDSIIKSESSLPVKPLNEAKIIWANNSIHQKTKFSLVYLHGFSASHEEGSPLHTEFAKRYGCNLFLSRLAYHGLKDSDAFANFQADSYYASAKTALQIGVRLGDSVILMATSAGGALALTLAASEQNIPIKALILYSPCIQIFDPNSKLLDKPWGLQIARFIFKGDYLKGREDSISKMFWYSKYRIEGVIGLQSFLDTKMNRNNFQKIHVPVLCLAYYKNKKIQDSTVSVPAIQSMFTELGTSSTQKELKLLPNVGSHVLACYIQSKDLNSVREATFEFAEKVLKLSLTKN
jgi:esterase/lipase